jgi:carbohydrate-selective porin OprB
MNTNGKATTALGLQFSVSSPGSTIINKKYNKAITHSYNWPKFTWHYHNKFLWSNRTFNSVHWKAFQHQGKNLASPAAHTYSSSSVNGY